MGLNSCMLGWWSMSSGNAGLGSNVPVLVFRFLRYGDVEVASCGQSKREKKKQVTFSGLEKRTEGNA